MKVSLMEYKYEKVKLENKIPAKITYFNRELLNDWKSDRGKKRLLFIGIEVLR